MRRTLLALSLSALGFCLAPAGVSADTVTMGSTLANPDDGGISSAPTVSTQLSFDPSTSPNPTVSPGNGLIIGWKVKSKDDGAIYTLKVLRPNGPVATVTMTNTNFTSITSIQAPSAIPVGTAVASPTGAIFTYPASLPISKGDYIGLLTGGLDDELPQFTANGLDRSLIANNFTGQPADGSSADLLSDKQHDLLLQATVKFCKVPDLLGKTEAEATQLITAADCAAGGPTTTPLIFKKKSGLSEKKRKKQKTLLTAARAKDGKVASQSPAAGETAVPGTAVSFTLNKLQVKKKKRKKK